ncbi:tetratricopeptide repeat protein [bacterium]|nr:tetratricopeptide repeat protein [bacterium]
MRKVVIITAAAVTAVALIMSCGKASDADLYSSGKDLESKGEYAKALTNYDVLISAHESSPLRQEALCRAGLLSFIRLHDRERALSYFQRVSREYPEDLTGQGCAGLVEIMQSDSVASPADDLYTIGLAYTNLLQDFDTGTALLQDLVTQYPEHKRAPEALFMSGFIYANSAADTARARVYYKRFLEAYPDHTLALSVEWELEHLGQDINSIPEMQQIDDSTVK